VNIKIMTVINYLCEYLSRIGASKACRDSLKANWNAGVKNRLGEYQDKKFIERRMILPDTVIKLHWADQSRMIYNEGNALWVASVVPAWRRGWSKHIKNEEVRELISTYFHFLTQFWHRCNVTPILVYIAYRYNELAGWVGSSDVHSQALSDEQFADNQKEKRITSFLKQVNCHHPLVHNACYHYLRMRQLLEHEFIEDAFVNMDCIAALARRRNLELRGSKTDLARLSIGADQMAIVNSLHKLRSEFAAHPSMTKWWDFSELFSDDVEKFTALSLTLILQIAKSYSTEKPVEQTFSGITNAPNEFHDCFWFNRIPLH
jgi:hypothetical protein